MEKVGSYKHVSFFTGAFPRVSSDIVLQGGRKYDRYSVLSFDPATKWCSLLEGDAVPYGILTEEIDATEGPVPATALLTGQVNRELLVFGGDDTWEKHAAALRDRCIFIEQVLEAK